MDDHEWFFAIDGDEQSGSSADMMKSRDLRNVSRKGVQILLFY